MNGLAAAETVDRIAAQLAAPQPPPADKTWLPQSLARGAAGVALLHIERAHTGTGSWEQAHRWITAAVAGGASAADTNGLYLGAPALAFMLHAAATGTPDRYRQALADLDAPVAALAHRRVDTALDRIRSGALPGFREYDVFYGLTGIGALLLRRDPGGSALHRILDYLVTLTRPQPLDSCELPGWWVGHDPHRNPSPHGHANLGIAHGITGPLALLARTMRRGITVDGHHEAIATICAWLDTWRQDGPAGPWWPEWITLAEHHDGQARQPGPARPSWCYGTPGIARAGQQAALALGDTRLRQHYEHALLACLDDPDQQARLTTTGLCHGLAGVYQTVLRAALDSPDPALDARLPCLAAALAHHPNTGTSPGLLDGDTGAALALHTAAQRRPLSSGWDTCLLID
ncbi:lanthionine synthetase C family protein [Actinosynnema sp. NPDC050436]|uniref:lanthionine synthetase C family protein n=1 Tax=Actinosynnema sp. NPDC050436 TaxID=3155659 RepID=UPI0033CCD151